MRTIDLKSPLMHVEVSVPKLFSCRVHQKSHVTVAARVTDESETTVLMEE